MKGLTSRTTKVTTRDNTRFSRAYILAGKAYQAGSDDNTNYSRLISSTDVESETSDFYGSVKLKEFDPVQWISGDSATRLTSRYIQRYSDTPREVTFDIEERKIQGITIGSVIEVVSIDKQSPSGATLTSNDRVQILKLQPNLNGVGRKYTATALAYTPLFATDPNEEQFVTLTGSIRSINLATYVGAPTNIPLNYTFIFDGCEIGSAEESSTWLASVRAGAWHQDSRLRIICTNNTVWSAKGGDGGRSYGNSLAPPAPPLGELVATSGGSGTDSYQSNGIKTEIYINYNAHGYNAVSLMLASGGGAGATAVYASGFDDGLSVSSVACISGSGGNGIPVGIAGVASATGSETNPNTKAYSRSYQGGDGASPESGAQGVSINHDDSDGSAIVIYTSRTRSSGYSSNGDSASSFITTASTSRVLNANGGLAGFSISGALAPADITVYNLSSESAKFKPGRSVAGVDYTLIDS